MVEPKQPIRAVSFDLDGTLFDHTRASLLALSALCRCEHVDPAGFLPVFHRHNDALWAAYARGTIDAGGIRVARFRRALGELRLDSAAAERWSESYLTVYQRLPFLMAGARTALDALARRVRLAVVTNGFADVQAAKLEALGLRRYFDAVATSEEAGAAKPAVAAFALAARRLGLPPDEIVHVGDSLGTDVEGARAAGMQTLWYRPGNRSEPRERDPPTVTDLRHIPARLGFPAARMPAHPRAPLFGVRRQGAATN